MAKYVSEENGYQPLPPLILVGFMAVGKSTLGRVLAEKLSYRFIDTDLLLENRFRTTISDLITSHGEAYFREREYAIVQEVMAHECSVIATGGGAPCYKDCMKQLLDSGVVVYLECPLDILSARLFRYRHTRPAVALKTAEEIALFVKEKLALREPVYLQAKYRVDVGKLETAEEVQECAEQILELYHREIANRE